MKQKKSCGPLGQWSRTPKTLSVFILAALLLVGCQKDVMPGVEENETASMSRAMPKATVIVNPGSSIQAAVNTAMAGTVIKIRPGTYTESVVINKPGITLMGEGNVVIQNPGGAETGITVKDGGDGFNLKNVTVKGFTERGVEIKNIDGFSLWQVAVINNGEFGLFAQYSNNGAIEQCEATGHTDTGIFVGESANVTISKSKTHGNTIGVETENASDITVDKNNIYNNTAGILCLLVPHASGILLSTNINLQKNQIRENNLANLQTGSSELESLLPSGIGILILGVNNALVQDNHVTDHKFTGIALISTVILGPLASLPPAVFASIDPNPDGAKIIANKLRNNGFAPQAGLPLPGVDLLWDGSGSNNCWSKNVYGTSFSPLPQGLPACQ